MLNSIEIKNIALIEYLDVSFDKGLNVLSGETGAGKSIIIDSLNFVLGKRADKSLIRYGSDSATVTAFFNIDNCPQAQNILNDFDIEIEDELMLKRTMTTEGKNNCNINGQKVTLAMLKQLTSTLVDIYGQNDNTFILNPSSHLSIVDDYGANDLKPVKDNFIEIYEQYHTCLNKLKEYGSLSDVAKNIDLYEYQINEIEEANLIDGEEEELISARHKLNHSQIILNSLNLSYEAINGDSSDNNILSIISIITSELNKVSEYDVNIEKLVERLETTKIEMKDIAATVQDIAENSEFDQNEFDRIEQRISLIRLLKKKYGNSIKDILEYLEDIKAKYDFLTGGEKNVAKLEEEKRGLFEKLYKAAVLLSKTRREIADKLSHRIETELTQLGMKNAKFTSKFIDIPNFDEITDIQRNGLDDVEFMFSANVGQPPKELSKIISGGELSRFMLALKNTIANLDGINTMVFDEIDSGISGNVAQVVAEKLYSISNNKQVLAITHLPQLAAMADSNFLIEKNSTEISTVTSLTLLYGDSLIKELARLIGGDQSSNYAIPHAIEMKEHANSLKK